jgi:adenylyltransferase/sulfurtransferase
MDLGEQPGSAVPGPRDPAAAGGDRYRRLARVVGVEAPGHLRRKRGVVVGCGALGSSVAELLVRSGIGALRLIDRDVVEEHNLADQSLYTEQDAAAARPKAEAAAARLRAVDGETRLEARVADFSPGNAAALVAGADVVLDCADNLETKYLINDVAVASSIPWIYAGCAGTQGTVLAVRPGQSHCFRCVWPEPPPAGWVDGCETMGILPATAAFIAAVQVTEALKILLDRAAELLAGVTCFDLWTAAVRQIPLAEFRREGRTCPACGLGDLKFLRGEGRSAATLLCGRDTVLLSVAGGGFDFAGARRRLEERLPVAGDDDCFRFDAEGCRFMVFATGKALIHGIDDPRQARILYGRYLLP